MRASQYLISTLKETPADAEVISHQLMLRAGLIRRLASGLYTWMPLGLRVLRKVQTIVREEMENAGALEVCMPVVQPAELWQESGRWEQYGPELMRLTDRHQREFCLGPTHEEVITDLARNELSSYKQLPLNLYQIQTKLRDEIRPRFGVMRSREFIMKDAYSFHLSDACLQQTYDKMHTAYCNVFSRIGLDFRPVMADSGSIGGAFSHEFHVLADSGEDDIVFSDSSDYAANIEKAEAIAPERERPAATAAMQQVETPTQKTIEAVAEFLKLDPSQCVKTLFVQGEDEQLIALVLRGDHSLNEVKAEQIEGIKTPLSFADEAQVKAEIGCSFGSLGPVGLTTRVIVDRAAAHLADFCCGANQDQAHLINVNWQRDLELAEVADLRNVVAGDPSPCGKGSLVIKRGIEVGHIFQLGNKYSTAMNATVLDENGTSQVMSMGCYGIGITRVVAAAIEQNHDDKGIVWPKAIAPFQVALIPINAHKSEAVKATCETLYTTLTNAGIDVLYMDTEKARLGVMLADTELMGIPARIVVGDRGLADNQVEFRLRTASDNEMISLDEVVARVCGGE